MRPYQDEETLRELYHEQEMSQWEIANKFGVTQPTIWNWMKRHDIEKRDGGNTGGRPPRHTEKPYRDADVLDRLYNEKGMSQSQIGQKFGCSQATINRWMKKHGIEAKDARGRGNLTAADTPATLRVLEYRDDGGDNHLQYEFWYDSNNYRVPVHRLLAVAEYGFEDVKGMYVHHKNEIGWDNRPDNIELMTPSDHTSHHNEGQATAD